MPLAARITDQHTCPVHGGGPTSSGETTVIIGGQPAARKGDSLVCGPPDAIAEGEGSVIIGGKEAARVGHATAHGGKIVKGCPTVRIGSDNQGGCMLAAAAAGSAMVESAE